MSRSTEHGARLAAAALLVVAAAGLVAPAYAGGEGPHVWAPDHLPAPQQARVYRLQARVYPLTAVSEDTAGAAEIEDGPRRLDVVLDSNVLFAKDSAVIRPAARRRHGSGELAAAAAQAAQCGLPRARNSRNPPTPSFENTRSL